MITCVAIHKLFVYLTHNLSLKNGTSRWSTWTISCWSYDAHPGAHALAVSRRSYTIKEKCELVQAISTLLSKGASIRQACPLFRLPHQYYHRFKKAVKAADDLEKANNIFVHYKVNGSTRKIHPGRPSILSAVRDDLQQFIAATRTHGIQVSSCMVRQEASRLLLAFRDKPLDAQKKAVLHFTKSRGVHPRNEHFYMMTYG